MVDLTQIVMALLTLVVAIVTSFLIPYIKSRTTLHQQEQINGWVRIAVAAAEQLITGSGQGEARKQYVLGFLQDHGYTLDDAQIDAMIEAAVWQLKQGLF